MKYVILFLLTFSFSHADYLKQTALACPTMQAIKNAPKNEGESGMDITLYSMANSCVIIGKNDKISAVDYEHKSKAIFQAIRHVETGKLLYTLRKNIVFEQAGSKNIFKF